MNKQNKLIIVSWKLYQKEKRKTVLLLSSLFHSSYSLSGHFSGGPADWPDKKSTQTATAVIREDSYF